MQKKSLLVALFCGALCLTGCLKNEESASVVQVRNAKANELNSIATLNEAKAAAELIYANADATLKGAEAELKKAEAALVLAMAETEKVRAELLKTQVALQEVKVEEEGIELLKKAAELEILLAKVEVEQAKAEAQKQYWANELEQLIADAEVAAVENGLELMKAQDAVEAYILTMEGAKADSAKVYAQKYFKAQNKLVELQAAELAARAARVLIENNAMSTREWIHNEIDKKNDTIAFNNERIAALEKYLDVDPETAKAALAEAWTELNEAYTAYDAATTAKTKAKDAQTAVENKKADFNNESYPLNSGSKWYYAFKQNIQDLFGWKSEGGIYDEDHTVPVALGSDWKVKAGGIVVRTEENPRGEFIPFWHNEKTFDAAPTRYPDDVTVSAYENGKPVDYVVLNHTFIAPATIYFDNIKGALDKVVAFEEEQNKEDIAKIEKRFEELSDDINEKIDTKEEWIAVHQDYVDERATKVAEAEEAYLEELGKVEAYEKAKKAAWKEFEEYMVVKYDISRALFMTRLVADSTYAEAVRDTLDKLEKRDDKKKTYDELKEAFVEEEGVFETFVAAEGAFNKVYAYSTTEKAEELWGKITGDTRFNGRFADALKNGGKKVPVSGYPQSEADYLDDNTQWIIDVDGTTYEAGTAQDSLYTWEYNLEVAAKALYIAEQDTVRYPVGTQYGAEKKQALIAAKEKHDGLDDDLYEGADCIEQKFTDAETDHNQLIDAYKREIHYTELETAKEAYNPDFNNNQITKLVTFPTTAYPKADFAIKSNGGLRYDREKGNWYVKKDNKKYYAGTAQAEFLDEVWAGVYASNRLARAEYKLGKAYDKFEDAEEDLLKANIALMKALGADIPHGMTYAEKLAYVKEHIADYIDEDADKKYQAYLDIEPDAHIHRARHALRKAYGFNPDEVKGQLTDDEYEYNKSKDAQFSWLRSSYMVDPKATMINTDSHDEYYEVGEEMPIAYFMDDIKYEEANSLVPHVGPVVPGFIPVPINGDDVPVILDPTNDEEPEPVLDEDGKPICTYKTSYQFQVDAATEFVEEILPEMLTAAKNYKEKKLAERKAEIASFLADVDEFKALEPGYKAWIAEREDAEEKVNEAKIAEFDAKKEWKEAKAEYDAAEAAVNQFVYVYNPKTQDYDKVVIRVAIKKIEKENEEIEARKAELELDLKYGKLTYQTVMEVLDETIEVLSADIEIWTAVANKYKTIMNGYLGVVDGEATPVVEEGEDEE